MEIPNPIDHFHHLFKRGDLVAVREFVALGANVNARNKFSWTPLMLAALEGQTPIVCFLISAGADITAVNDSGVSALAYAALKGHSKTIQALLEAGAPLNVKPHGGTLLGFASVGGANTQQHVELLRAAGAE
ncbi:MAG: ankyrin repeat domain-containing protein [Holophagaceae bacterium]|jgi:ankyrin repeat protein|uniref:Ankyrin repeat domain-containing protein n=1 Tax=Candidatus Geothrix odensensis TaxID=2954440 RepID=A0A936K5W9_9BACT|nr:ankyrin repeat domain-containing protein [Candidatus Geothrix odensensis]